MAAGLWIARILPTHPLAYVPAVGPTAGQRWQNGAIASFFEGDSGQPPDAGSLNPPIYQWRFFPSATVADLVALLPAGVTGADNVRAHLKLKNSHTGNLSDVEEWE